MQCAVCWCNVQCAKKEKLLIEKWGNICKFTNCRDFASSAKSCLSDWPSKLPKIWPLSFYMSIRSCCQKISSHLTFIDFDLYNELASDLTSRKRGIWIAGFQKKVRRKNKMILTILLRWSQKKLSSHFVAKNFINFTSLHTLLRRGCLIFAPNILLQRHRMRAAIHLGGLGVIEEDSNC